MILDIRLGCMHTMCSVSRGDGPWWEAPRLTTTSSLHLYVCPLIQSGLLGKIRGYSGYDEAEANTANELNAPDLACFVFYPGKSLRRNVP